MNKLNRMNIFIIPLMLLCSYIFINSNTVQAQTTTLYTDELSWENQVINIEMLETIAANIELADQVSSTPVDHTDVGSILTFQKENTGFSRSFSVETMQSGASFIFNEEYEGAVYPSYANALSVGLGDSYEEDDWRFDLLDGASVNAFGIVFIGNKFEDGESISLFYGRVLKDTIDLSSFMASDDFGYFIGITTDFMFDGIIFNEDSGGDDIAIADFRIASSTVEPEPIISSTLFIVGAAAFIVGAAAALGIRRFWAKRK